MFVKIHVQVMFLYISLNKYSLTCRILLQNVPVAVWSPPEITVTSSYFLK